MGGGGGVINAPPPRNALASWPPLRVAACPLAAFALRHSLRYNHKRLVYAEAAIPFPVLLLGRTVMCGFSYCSNEGQTTRACFA